MVTSPSPHISDSKSLISTTNTLTTSNRADLNILATIGASPNPDHSIYKDPSHPRTTLRVAGKMVLALVRTRRSAERWRTARKVHDGLVKKVEVMKAGPVDKSGVAAQSGSRVTKQIKGRKAIV